MERSLLFFPDDLRRSFVSFTVNYKMCKEYKNIKMLEMGKQVYPMLVQITDPPNKVVSYLDGCQIYGSGLNISLSFVGHKFD